MSRNLSLITINKVIQLIGGVLWALTRNDGANDNQVGATVSYGVNTGNDFLDAVTGTVGGHLYRDSNGNGVQDAGEVGIEGVLVTLSFDTAVLSSTNAQVSTGSVWPTAPTGHAFLVNDAAGTVKPANSNHPLV